MDGRELKRARVRGPIAALCVAVAAAATFAALPGGSALAAPATVVAGEADWGVKASFRSYVTGPIAHGTVTPGGGATANADGSFRFQPATGTYDSATGAITSALGGSVRFTGHDGQLDLNISDIRVQRGAGAAAGQLVADVESRELGSADVQIFPDVTFADLDFAGVAPSNSGQTSTWAGVPATLTESGADAFAGFYTAGTELDPVTLSLQVEAPVTWTPHVTVAKVTDVNPDGETVTVTGTGFDPNANVSTRPPVPVGMPTGVYVVFGRFADDWKPSAGAAASTRQVIDQKWALPAASQAAAEAAHGPNAQYVALGADGSFTTTLNLETDDTKTGNYGVATYAAGGAAANASQETFTPVSFRAPGEPNTSTVTRVAGSATFAGPDGPVTASLNVNRVSFFGLFHFYAGSATLNDPGRNLKVSCLVLTPTVARHGLNGAVVAAGLCASTKFQFSSLRFEVDDLSGAGLGADTVGVNGGFGFSAASTVDSGDLIVL